MAPDEATDLILVVDDEVQIRDLVARMLSMQGLACEVAAGAAEAHRLLDEKPFALVLTDVNMPGGSGMDLVRHVFQAHRGVAAVMITGIDDPQLAAAALELGAYGYLLKPFGALELEIQVTNALLRRRLELAHHRREQGLVRTVDEQTALLRQTQEETIRRFALAIEVRNSETGIHVERVGTLCALLAQQLGWSPERCDRIRLASVLHDVGKIAIPDRLLLKPGSLTVEERAQMERHTTIGHRILAGSPAELLSLAAEIALHHHERYDGLGYPLGLRGEHIPIEARIVSVVDVFDALTTDRPYRRAFPVGQAISMMQAERGCQFDAEVFDAFLETLPVVLDMWQDEVATRHAVG